MLEVRLNTYTSNANALINYFQIAKFNDKTIDEAKEYFRVLRPPNTFIEHDGTIFWQKRLLKKLLNFLLLQNQRVYIKINCLVYHKFFKKLGIIWVLDPLFLKGLFRKKQYRQKILHDYLYYTKCELYFLVHLPKDIDKITTMIRKMPDKVKDKILRYYIPITVVTSLPLSSFMYRPEFLMYNFKFVQI